jgi:hypothetical protein
MPKQGFCSLRETTLDRFSVKTKRRLSAFKGEASSGASCQILVLDTKKEKKWQMEKD